MPFRRADPGYGESYGEPVLKPLRFGGRGAIVAGLLVVIAIPSLALLTIRRGLVPDTGALLAVSYPAGTLVQPPRPLPAFDLIDEQGRATSLAHFRGKWLVIAPAMTLCRETCPLTTAALATLTGELRHDRLGWVCRCRRDHRGPVA
jgi:cytochrome oxidase Cu insertion factor (SCO1/SenC/PrrC family)